MNDVTFIIPVRVDSPERLNNLDFCVHFLRHNFDAKVIIMEEDCNSKISGRYEGVRHVFIESQFPIFQRTRLINQAVNEIVDTGAICLLDMDVFIDADIYRVAVEYLKEYSVVYPFSGKFYDIPNSYSLNKDLKVSDIDESDMSLLNVNGIGAMVFFRTTDFIKGGMENENFLGWGYEDNERFVRFTKLGFRVKRMDNPIFHFSHPRGLNSSGMNPNVIKNRTECEKIEHMQKSELIQYIDKTFHWCRKRKIMKMSIVIPTYEAQGRGEEFVKYNIGKIFEQTFTDYYVVVSDHSVDDNIKNLVESYRDDRLIYLRNTNNRGSSTANLNFAIAHAPGEIIKPIMHDDYLCNPRALELIHAEFLRGAKWVMTATNDTTDRKKFTKTLVPSWNDELVHGVNTFGCPSALAYLKDNEIRWDERLLWLMDVKMYYDLHHKFGMPSIISELCVTNLCHDGQLTVLLESGRKKMEVELMKSEHP